jgi:hypothetical protein
MANAWHQPYQPLWLMPGINLAASGLVDRVLVMPGINLINRYG